MQWIKFFSYLLLIFFLPEIGIARPYYGASFSSALVSSEPESLHSYQLLVNYDPDRLTWHQFNLYFDGGIAHLWLNGNTNHSSLNIYSIAPVVRYAFKKKGQILPYFELSIGVSYLNQTRIEKRNLGIHFIFQDRLGIGALLGTAERFSIGLHAVHYSNAHLSSHNSGITIPLVLDVGYRFN